MGDCPQCGLADPGPVDFCPDPQCRAYLGRASAAAVSPLGPAMAGSTAMGPSTGGSAAGQAQKRGVRVSMEPDDLTVDPGSQATAKVTVRNLGTRVEEFELVIQGPGAVFATVMPATLSVYPDVEQYAVVRFAPPRGPESLAGASTFEVLARSLVHSDVRDVVRGRLTITAFENLQAVLRPDSSRGRKRARHQVTVTNGGNTPMNAQVAFADQGKVLTFEPGEKQLALPPGNTVDVPVLLNGPRKWFGRTEQLPFSAVVSPAGGQPPITLNGVRQQTAVFPWWVPPGALAVVAVLIALAALFSRPATVPTIGNEDQQTAAKKLTSAGYIPVVQHQTDDNIAPGLAIGTDPKGGTALPRNQVVKLIMSDGKCQGTCPITIEIPNVVGMQQADATARLQQAGIGVRTEPKDSTEAAGTVIDTTPKPATQIKNGDVVTLMVSKGPPAPPADGGGQPPAPKQVQVPALQGHSVADATKELQGMGLKAKAAPSPVHSNAVPHGTVLSSDPAGGSKVASGSEVTLTVAQNTALVNLVDTADKATWTATGTTSEKLTFGTRGTGGAFVNKRAGSLGTSPVTTLLETRPPDDGLITGEYQLAAPVVPGDHVKALVGLFSTPSSGTGGGSATESGNQVTFTVEANGQTIKSVTVTPGTPQSLDADLSSAQGAASIKVIVASSGKQDRDVTPVWQGLQVAPTVGQ